MTDVSSAPFVRVAALGKAFEGRPVLRGIDTELPRARITAVLGSSGSGKSTFLRILAGLTEPDTGTVVIDGATVIADGEQTPARAEVAPRIGMVFQNYTLWPHLDVLANLTLAPRKRLGLTRAEATARAEGVLAEVGMASHMRSRPAQLSGGERQRVAIARALMMRPKLLLCDEITSALDPRVAADLLDVLLRLQHADGLTVVLVTHDIPFATRAADHLVFFEDGRVVAGGARDEALAAGGPLRAFIDGSG
jgi:ABC-type polar amino acid transport system ATPase subunit